MNLRSRIAAQLESVMKFERFVRWTWFVHHFNAMPRRIANNPGLGVAESEAQNL